MNAFDKLVEIDGGVPMYFDDPEWKAEDDPWGLDEEEGEPIVGGTLKFVGKSLTVGLLIGSLIVGGWRLYGAFNAWMTPINCPLSIEEFQAQFDNGDVDQWDGSLVEWRMEGIEISGAFENYWALRRPDGRITLAYKGGVLSREYARPRLKDGEKVVVSGRLDAHTFDLDYATVRRVQAPGP